MNSFTPPSLNNSVSLLYFSSKKVFYCLSVPVTRLEVQRLSQYLSIHRDLNYYYFLRGRANCVSMIEKFSVDRKGGERERESSGQRKERERNVLQLLLGVVLMVKEGEREKVE